MEISNPIALQYVSNQGLASQLNTQGKQLPVKSERFSVEKKVPAPTEDEQRLRSEAENRRKPPESTKEEEASIAQAESKNNSAFAFTQPTYPIPANATNNLAASFQNTQQQETGQSPALPVEKGAQDSIPIKRYLETSSINSATSNLSTIDFFI